MNICDWTEFNLAFGQYIANTIGLFTLKESDSFTMFNLDAFLERHSMYDMNHHTLSVTQYEMFMALSTFISIEEAYKTINIDLFPLDIKLKMKVYIEKKLIQLDHDSQIKYGCLNFMNPQVYVVAPAA